MTWPATETPVLIRAGFDAGALGACFILGTGWRAGQRGELLEDGPSSS